MQHALIDYLVNAVWQIPLVAIGAAVVARFGGLGPRGRHHVWLTALALALVLPAAPSATALYRLTPVAPTAAAEQAMAAAPPPAVLPVTAVSASASSLPPVQFDADAARLVLITFAAITVLGLVRLVVAWRSTAGMVSRSRPLVLAPGVDMAMRGLARAHGRPLPPVRQSDEVRGPVVVGAMWPVILAPRAFARLDEDEQRAAMLHEVAHVVRRDFAVNLICEAAATPIAWHPVSHEIKAGVRRSRELACDAMASRSMTSSDTYARCLLSLAKTLHAPEPGPGTAVLVGLIGRSDLEERLMQLISGPSKTRAGRLLAAGAAACAVVAPALVLHVTPAYAQAPASAEAPLAPAASEPPAPPAPPVPPRYAVHHHHHGQPMVGRGREGPAVETPDEDHAEPPLVDEARIQEIVRHAVEQANASARVMASAEVQKAMAELRTHQGELSVAQREEIRQAAREAAEAWKSAHLEETLAEVRREMGSPEVRHALEQASRFHELPPIPPAPPAPPAPPPPPPPPPPPGA